MDTTNVNNGYAYVWRCALVCADCAFDVEGEILYHGHDDDMPDDFMDEETYHSAQFPKGPYPIAPSDRPHDCSHCGAFLGNDLTEAGIEYVLRRMVHEIITDEPLPVALAEWAPFYGIPIPDSMLESRGSRMNKRARKRLKRAIKAALNNQENIIEGTYREVSNV